MLSLSVSQERFQSLSINKKEEIFLASLVQRKNSTISQGVEDNCKIHMSQKLEIRCNSIYGIQKEKDQAANSGPLWIFFFLL